MLTDFAKEVGAGNFTSEYHPLSSRDTLGHALLKMRSELDENEKVLERPAWLLWCKQRKDQTNPAAQALLRRKETCSQYQTTPAAERWQIKMLQEKKALEMRAFGILA